MPGDRSDDALATGAVARRKVVAIGAEVDVVPARGGPEPGRVAVAQVVGPVGDAGQRGIRRPGEQSRHFPLRGRREVPLREFADQAMAERAPGLRRGARHQQEQQGERAACGGKAHGGLGVNDGAAKIAG